jgi:hypothetical protein
VIVENHGDSAVLKELSALGRGIISHGPGQGSSQREMGQSGGQKDATRTRGSPGLLETPSERLDPFSKFLSVSRS